MVSSGEQSRICSLVLSLGPGSGPRRSPRWLPVPSVAAAGFDSLGLGAGLPALFRPCVPQLVVSSRRHPSAGLIRHILPFLQRFRRAERVCRAGFRCAASRPCFQGSRDLGWVGRSAPRPPRPPPHPPPPHLGAPPRVRTPAPGCRLPSAGQAHRRRGLSGRSFELRWSCTNMRASCPRRAPAPGLRALGALGVGGLFSGQPWSGESVPHRCWWWLR